MERARLLGSTGSTRGWMAWKLGFHVSPDFWRDLRLASTFPSIRQSCPVLCFLYFSAIEAIAIRSIALKITYDQINDPPIFNDNVGENTRTVSIQRPALPPPPPPSNPSLWPWPRPPKTRPDLLWTRPHRLGGSDSPIDKHRNTPERQGGNYSLPCHSLQFSPLIAFCICCMSRYSR